MQSNVVCYSVPIFRVSKQYLVVQVARLLIVAEGRTRLLRVIARDQGKNRHVAYTATPPD